MSVLRHDTVCQTCQRQVRIVRGAKSGDRASLRVFEVFLKEMRSIRGHNPKRSRMRKVKNGRSKDVSVLVSMLASVLSG